LSTENRDEKTCETYVYIFHNTCKDTLPKKKKFTTKKNTCKDTHKIARLMSYWTPNKSK